MPKLNAEERATRALDRLLNRPERAKLGKYTNDPANTVVYNATGLPGYVYVTKDDQTTPLVLNRGLGRVPIRAYLRVLIKMTPTGYVMWGEDADLAAPLVAVESPYGVETHAATHQHAGTDEVATATPAANAIPKADGSGLLDAWVTHTDVGAAIHAADAKTTPVDADTMPLIDSADSNVLKKMTWANLKATLQTAFSSVFAHISNGVTNGDGHDHNGLDGAQLDHTVLYNIGTNTHAQIDTHVSATAAHGATGAVVGTTNTQTLTNKTLTTPTIASLANAQHSHTAASGGGTIDYVDLTSAQTVGGIKTFTDAMGIGASPSSGSKLAIVQTDTSTSAHLTLRVTGNFTPSSSNASRHRAMFIQANMAGASNLTDATLGLVGLGMQAVQGGTGTITGMAGFEGLVRVNGAAAVTNAFGIYAQIRNENAAAVITNGMGIYVDDPVTTGPITNSYGIYVKPAIKNYLAGSLGIGTAAPQGPLHIHDGRGGSIFVTKTGVNGTAQTIIPDGAGDVTRMVYFEAIASDGTNTEKSIADIAPSNSTTLIVGSGTLKFEVAANGKFTVQRTSGSGTFDVTIEAIWQ